MSLKTEEDQKDHHKYIVNNKRREQGRKCEKQGERMREMEESPPTCKSHRDSATQSSWVLCKSLEKAKDFFSYRRKNKEDTSFCLLGARCVMIADERENRATGSCKPPASCAERKFFVLEGELQEVVSMNGSQESRALSIAGRSASLNPSKLCHPRCQKELIADKLAALILSSLTGPKDLECCFKKKKKLYLFIFGCTGSSLLQGLFLVCSEQGLRFVVLCGLLIARASLAVKRKLQVLGLQVLQQAGLVAAALRLQSLYSVVATHRFSCSVACGIPLDQGQSPCPLHWQADSYLLYHQGSPGMLLLNSRGAKNKNEISIQLTPVVCKLCFSDPS